MKSQLLRQGRIIPVVVLIVMAVLLLASCVEPSPLFGTWADNKGSTLIFFTDDTFNAKILSSGTTKNYEGSYTVLLNSLTMNCTELGLRVVTEWDIRGNILYINWVTEDGDSLSLSLFKIAN